MRWFIFIIFYILVDLYAYQAVRAITRSNWVSGIYVILSLLVLGNLIFQLTSLILAVDLPAGEVML